MTQVATRLLRGISKSAKSCLSDKIDACLDKSKPMSFGILKN